MGSNSALLTRYFPSQTHKVDYHAGGKWYIDDSKRCVLRIPPRRLMINHTIESCWIPSLNKVEWPWRYRSRSKVITCDTPSHASNHLYQIWKESIQNYRRYRADRIFKFKAEWYWKYRSRSKVITCNTPSNANDDSCLIWKEYKQNCRFFFKVKSEKFETHKVDYHAGGKWYIDDSKRCNENQLKSLKLSVVKKKTSVG